MNSGCSCNRQNDIESRTPAVLPDDENTIPSTGNALLKLYKSLTEGLMEKYPLETGLLSTYTLLMSLITSITLSDNFCGKDNITWCIVIWSTLAVLYLISNLTNLRITMLTDELAKDEKEATWDIIFLRYFFKLTILPLLMLTVDMRPFECWVDRQALQGGVLIALILITALSQAKEKVEKAMKDHKKHAHE